MVQVSHLHGGDLMRASALFGGEPGAWLDLSTGINPVAYPVGDIPPAAWTALPDTPAYQAVIDAARTLWHVPSGKDVVLASGASAIIAALPRILSGKTVRVLEPTYSEHAKAFAQAGWLVNDPGNASDVIVGVHPNNPDGALRQENDFESAPLAIVDESFADVGVDSLAAMPRPAIVLKSFGKFWGLAGVRLGFAICDPDHAEALRQALGPWHASGPALHIAARALSDLDWIAQTRRRLQQDADRLDQLVETCGGRCIGGTTLFRLYDVRDGRAWQAKLAHHRIWTRTFDYAPGWLRIGLPAPGEDFERLKRALA
ncbi:aminotransferase class I/II-fold pyridoxal phosphate-dependent enzyme [Pontivivens insulae]|uniref:Threonine-phosphate decarboxylase n=1 Tax=Pontivivens insulae TaxID=1639689 RepID=A0A2R8AF96_9RHOB|nr:aminotransferase class I/II-fold pyridoxal phosphate-dependent enzyme [Pontivivens insulae]RED12100.1 L-threonine O-3-phosphate decarboxylase [Pontivivens insulae]SPF30856.1 Threonine-phosphate decarboxylase [Pontivivens insulae]